MSNDRNSHFLATSPTLRGLIGLRPLDGDPFYPQYDTVIAPAESLPVEPATSTILIVDDDRSVADTFARMLKLEGF